MKCDFDRIIDRHNTMSQKWDAQDVEFGLVIMMTTGYLATVAARQGTSKQELLAGNVGGEGFLFLVKIMLIFSFILNASVIAGSQVPVVTLGDQLGGWFGKVYGIILVLAVYTTAVGMAWQVVLMWCLRRTNGISHYVSLSHWQPMDLHSLDHSLF